MGFPVVPLLASMALFSAGLLVCGLAPSMEVLLVGRVLQGLGGGALTVGLYVVVGLVFPAALRPAVFASFAAAWVLPALFGPGLAALVALASIGQPRSPGGDAVVPPSQEVTSAPSAPPTAEPAVNTGGKADGGGMADGGGKDGGGKAKGRDNDKGNGKDKKD